MKKRILVIALAAALLAGCGTQEAASAGKTSVPDAAVQTVRETDTPSIPQAGEVVNGFETMETRDFPAMNASVVRFVHQKTGAELYYIANDDTNRIFDLTFRTESPDDTGIPHVFEHAITDGSEKYPSRQLYYNLQYQTYNTYMNATTFDRCTTYPVGSMSEAQLLKLADFYTDSCFHPLLMEDETIFRTEAWRYRLDDPEDPLTIEGTVYSEMLGKRSVERSSYLNFLRDMFPGTTVGNEFGGDPDHIPELTWQRLKDYHEQYYHPSNCTAYLYGRFEDYAAFLELLDGYFSAYEKKEFDHTESGYEPLTGPVVRSVPFPVEKGSDTEHASVIYYGFLCPGLKEDRDQELVLNTLTDILTTDGSVLQQSFQEALPYGELACFMEMYGPDDAIVFCARNVDPEDAEVFRSVVDKALSDAAENGFAADQVEAAMTTLQMSALLAREEGDPVGKVIEPMAEYDANSIEPWNYLDFEESLFLMDQWNEQGLYTKGVSEWLAGSQKTALVTTWPEPGTREVKDAELAEKLAGIKAEMTEDEINAIVADSNADYETDDTSEMVASLQAVTAESLPEDWRLYELRDETGGDGIRHIDAVAETEGIGEVKLLLDTSGFDQEDIHWLSLYTYLLAGLETGSHSKGDLATMIRRYLYNPEIRLTSYQEGEDGFHPWLAVSWTALDDNLDKGYDLIREILFETRFDDPDKLLKQIQTIQAAYRNGIDQNIEDLMLNRAFARDSLRMRYDSYIYGLEFYDFLVRTRKQLQEDPGTVTAKLQGIQDKLNNRMNAVVIYAGSENGIALNRSLSDQFLASLNAEKIERAEYDLPVPEKKEALIFDSSVQYNMMNISYSALGMEDYEGWMTVAAHIVTDFYLTPILRDRYGVYDPYCANKDVSDGGIYIFSYQDPGIASTFRLINSLPEKLRGEEIDQETINSYILSSYTNIAKQDGLLSGGVAAAEAALQGQPQDQALVRMRQAKQCTPEKLAKWAEMLEKLTAENVSYTAGGAAAINAEADRYDKILNPFNAKDR